MLWFTFYCPSISLTKKTTKYIFSTQALRLISLPTVTPEGSSADRGWSLSTSWEKGLCLPFQPQHLGTDRVWVRPESCRRTHTRRARRTPVLTLELLFSRQRLATIEKTLRAHRGEVQGILSRVSTARWKMSSLPMRLVKYNCSNIVRMSLRMPFMVFLPFSQAFEA